MKTTVVNAVSVFFAGFFAKDILDNIFFLVIDKYPITIFGFQITATSHKIMLVVSLVLTAVFLYNGFRKNRNSKQSVANG